MGSKNLFFKEFELCIQLAFEVQIKQTYQVLKEFYDGIGNDFLTATSYKKYKYKN